MTESKTPSRRRSTKAANEQEPIAPAAPETEAAAPVIEEHTGPAQPEEVKPFVPQIGAYVATENFNLNIGEHGGGAPLLNVARKGWVGPAQLVTHANLIEELIEGLVALRDWKPAGDSEA